MKKITKYIVGNFIDMNLLTKELNKFAYRQNYIHCKTMNVMNLKF